jgi:ribosomal subunit interface protein
MKTNIKATNVELTAAIKDAVTEKFGGLDKYFTNILQIDVEVGTITKGQQKGNIFFCEVNVSVPQKLLRYKKETDDLYKAINDVKKGIQLELKKYKEKIK